MLEAKAIWEHTCIAGGLFSLPIQLKIAEAKNLLRFTDMSLAEISEYLAFSSQSYFQSVFKKETGDTPNEYRRLNKLLVVK